MAATTIPYSITQGLTGYWTMDEASGSRADSTGSNNLSLVGTAVGNSATAINGNSASLPGSTSFLQSTTFAGQTGPGFTFSCWIMPSSISANGAFSGTAGTILKFGSVSDNGIRLELGVNNSTYISLFANEGAQANYTTAAANNWYHVVVTIDNQSTSGGKLYVNNSLVQSFNTNQWNMGFVGLLVGSYTSAGQNFYNGLIDELACWNRPLTQTEVGTLWNNGSGYTLATPYYPYLNFAFSNTAQNYTGSAVSAPTITTSPSPVTYTLQYVDSNNSTSSTPPANAGTYTVRATITDSRYVSKSLVFSSPFYVINWNSQYGTQLSAYWRMGESSGNRADATGNGYTMTQSGGTVSSAAGIFANNAASFPPGNTAYLVSPTGLFDVGTASKSISLWFKLDQSYLYNNTQWLFHTGSGQADGWGLKLYVDGSGTLQFTQSPNLSGGWSSNISGSGKCQSNTWHHVVIVFSQAINTGTTKLFLDGQLIGSQTYGGYINVTNTGYQFGHSPVNTEGYYGLIGEAALWGRALSDAEAIQLYNNGSGYPFPSGFASTQYAQVIISNTGQAYTGSALPVTVTTVPSGLTTSVTYTDQSGNSSSSAPSAVGLYTVTATVTSAGYTGSATTKASIFNMPSSMSNSLAGYWRMSETNGNRLDSTGGSSIVETGGIVYSGIGINGTAASFANSQNAWLTMPAGICDIGSLSKSFSFWMYIDPSTQRSAIYLLTQGTGTDGNDWSLYLDHDSYYGLRFQASTSRNSWDIDLHGTAAIYTPPGSSTATTITLNNAVGSWHHVALTLDGSTIKVYFDGGLAGQTTYSKPIESSGSSFKVARYATNPTNASYFTVGKYQDLAIWNRALSTQEIGILYNNGCGSSFPNNAQFTTYVQITISNLSQMYNGSQCPVTVTTNPSGISIITTYTDSQGNSSTTPPSAVGSYTVNVVTNNSAYSGSATAQLNIIQFNTQLQNGLNSVWRLDEVSGDRADSSGNGYTLSINGSNSIGSNTGIINSGALFPGTIGYFLQNNSISFSYPFSVSCWIKPSSISGNYSTNFQTAPANIAWTAGTSATEAISLYLGSSNQLCIYSSWDKTIFPFYYSLQASAWTHVVLCFSSGSVSMYVNGLQAVNGSGVPYTYSSSVPSNLSLNGFIIGAANTTGQCPFNGVIDEVYTWNRVLSPQEAQQLYGAGYADPFPASITVKPEAKIIVNNTAQDYTGSPCPVTVTTVPSGLTTVINYTDPSTGTTSTTAPTGVGAYNFTVTVNSSQYDGATTGTLIIAQYPNTIARNTLAYWRMEEGSGTRTDSSGNSYSLTEYRGPVNSAKGIIGNGALFYGSGTAVLNDAGANQSLFNNSINPNTNFTISCWVYPDNVDDDHTVWCIGTNGGNVYRLRNYYTNNFYIETPSQGTPAVSPQFSYNQWYNLVSVFTPGKITSYCNGNYYATINLSESVSNSTGIYIGWDPIKGVSSSTNYNHGWHGVIDEFAVWSRALNATEVSQVYNSGYALYIPSPFPIPATITVTSNTNVAYTGSQIPVAYTVSPGTATSTIVYQDAFGNTTTTPPTIVGNYTYAITVTDNAHYGNLSGTLTVTKAAATVTVSNTTQTYNTQQLPVTASVTMGGVTTPMGPNFGQTPGTITYQKNDGSAATQVPPTNAGVYTVVATLVDSNYQGTATATYTIQKCNPTITVSNTTQSYTGSPCPVTVATSVAGLNYNVTYNGSNTVPTQVGVYPVVVTTNDQNSLTVTQSSSLSVTQANASISLSNLTTTYSGSPQQPRIIVTNQNGSVIHPPLTVTYGGSTTQPTNTGSYTVVVTINDPEYNAVNATGNFVITPQPVIVTISSLSQVYQGNPVSVVVNTDIPGITTATVYTDTNGTSSTNPPTSIGQYFVTSTVTTPGYSGSASANLVVYASLPLSTAPGAVNYVTASYNANTQLWYVMNFSRALRQ